MVKSNTIIKTYTQVNLKIKRVFFTLHLSFDISFLGYLFVFLLIGLALYLSGMLAIIYFSRRVNGDARLVPVAAFIGVISTAWALSLGFAANDIWNNNFIARQAAKEEQSSLIRMLGLVGPDVLDEKKIFELTLDYAEAVIEDEWVEAKNAEGSMRVELILNQIRRELVDLSTRNSYPAIIANLINGFDNLQNLRMQRLSIGGGWIDIYKWYLLLFLTLLTVVSIAASHADKREAGVLAIRIYVIAATISLWIIALHANPYQGVDKIGSDKLGIIIP